MDDQLTYLPCGYIVLADEGTILEINETLLNLLGYEFYELQNRHVNSILTVSSRSFYQIYFFPMIKLQNKVEEMYITLKTKKEQDIPVLLNASRKERGGKIVNDCVFTPMQQRSKYEKNLLTIKKETEERNRVKKEQIVELDLLRRELESKQKELLEANCKLRQLAITDGLTGLKNRRYLQENLEPNIALYTSLSRPLAFMLLDIDHFKKINDVFGHLMGDKILRKLGNILMEETREEDVAARYGGEEFALILPNTDLSAALRIAEKIRSRVENTDWTIPAVTVSIGVTILFPGDTESTLQSRADQALYSSKKRGRNKVTSVCQQE